LLFSYLFAGPSNIIGFYNKARANVKEIKLIAIIDSLFSIILLSILTPFFGIWGIIISRYLARISISIYSWIIVRNSIKKKYSNIEN
jgi:O-antigen/teichoic acid export membrane protein